MIRWNHERNIKRSIYTLSEFLSRSFDFNRVECDFSSRENATVRLQNTTENIKYHQQFAPC